MENGSDLGCMNFILSVNIKLIGNNVIIINIKLFFNIINIYLNKDLVVKGIKNEIFCVI